MTEADETSAKDWVDVFRVRSALNDADIPIGEPNDVRYFVKRTTGNVMRYAGPTEVFSLYMPGPVNTEGPGGLQIDDRYGRYLPEHLRV